MIKSASYHGFLLVLTGYLFVGMASSVHATTQPEETQFDTSIYVMVEASTWKTRGRILYDVKSSLIRKLDDAGFRIVRKKHDPHAFTLSVQYREVRGPAYAVNQYGTDLSVSFFLIRDYSDILWEFTIFESSENSISGTPPYLDAVQKFDTNPYYFFIGGLLRKFIDQGLNIEHALLIHLQSLALQSFSSFSEVSELHDAVPTRDHSMESTQELYLPIAIVRSIEEFVGCDDRRVIPILTRLLGYPNETVRLGATEALGRFEAS